MTIGSLFSGIGGLELGLERAGLGPVRWQCEIDPFCRSVLQKHWPTVERFHDVTQPRRYPKVDIICGGFPCQDVSSAGKRRGIGGARSGLWRHFASVVRQVKPRVVVVENVASGKAAWLPTVRRDLHLLGYDSTAYALSAADVGAPHRRRRLFVVAYAYRHSKSALPLNAEVAGASPSSSSDATNESELSSAGLASRSGSQAPPIGTGARLAGWGNPKPEMVRVVHGVPRGLDSARRKSLGNSVVPQCAEVIGRVIADQIARAA